MVLRRGERGGQAGKAELLEPGEEFLALLAAEDAEYQLGGGAGGAPCHHQQDEPGDPGMVEPRDCFEALLHGDIGPFPAPTIKPAAAQSWLTPR